MNPPPHPPRPISRPLHRLNPCAWLPPAAIALTVAAGCTAAPPPPAPPAPPPSTAAAPAPSGDFQTGPPDNGQATTAAPRPAASSMATQGPPVQPGQPGTPRGQSIPDTKIALQDPSVVAQTFTARLLEVDTRFDNRPADANPRAARLATPKLAATLAQRPQGQVPGWFSDLKQRAGWTGVTTTLDGLGEQPPDSPTLAYRAVTSRTTPLANGWQGEPQTATWVITMTKTSPGSADWRVDAFQVLS